MTVQIGWRKLTAWFLCFLLCAAVSIIHMLHNGQDIPPNVVVLLKFVTGAFFFANMGKAVLQKLAQ